MKYALVTGANCEIAKSICETLLEEDFIVIAGYHNDNKDLKKIKNSNLIIKHLDVTDEKNIKQIFAQFPNIDVIVNAAAVCFDCEMQEKTKKEFMDVFETNVVGPFLISKYAKNACNIINISSTDGIDTYNAISMDYCASKAALNNLTKTLAMALPSTNVTALALGWVNTHKNTLINQEYLHTEMQRTNQKKLIELDEINEYVKKILKNAFPSGSIIRIDGEYDVY